MSKYTGQVRVPAATVTTTYEARVNVICSMLYQRGQRQRNGIRTVSRKQVENVVTKYNEREHVTMTSREILRASTNRWAMSPTMEKDRFLLLVRQPAILSDNDS